MAIPYLLCDTIQNTVKQSQTSACSLHFLVMYCDKNWYIFALFAFTITTFLTFLLSWLSYWFGMYSESLLLVWTMWQTFFAVELILMPVADDPNCSIAWLYCKVVCVYICRHYTCWFLLIVRESILWSWQFIYVCKWSISFHISSSNAKYKLGLSFLKQLSTLSVDSLSSANNKYDAI